MKTQSIKTYVINLKHRTDRKTHIIKEFHGRDEFNLKIIEACEHAFGAVGLWGTLKHIILNLTDPNDDYILVCEDDHQFTEHYDTKLLFKLIEEAKSKETDILLGGLSWYESALQISSDFFWMDAFTGLQFTVIYRKFFETILTADFAKTDAADYKIASLTRNKLVMHPFISVQKEFGYSDVTVKNNIDGYINQLFSDASEKLDHLKSVATFYKTKNSNEE